MAFVFEKERSSLYPQKDHFQNLGPGQYLPVTEFKFQNPELVPFGVSTFRQFPEKPNHIRYCSKGTEQICHRLTYFHSKQSEQV